MFDSRMRHEGELFEVQPDVRRLVDLINHLLNENRLLREELDTRRTLSDDTTVVTKAGVLRQMIGRATVLAHQEILGSTTQVDSAPRRDANGSDRPPPVHVEHLRWEPRAPSPPLQRSSSIDDAIVQIEDLRTEVRQLRDEFRQIQRLQPLSPATVRESASTPSGPRLEPIRLDRTQASNGAGSQPWMWMKLRQPWFFVPLAWAMAIGLIALAIFVIFFN